ncbi:MAG: pilus assembly protein [Propionibacteriaceae bacterium]|nr:pilus assembly protein [Propionibacteriaceae bacterium]
MSSRSRGSVSIEAIVLIPLFLGTVLLIVHTSLWVYAQGVAHAACLDAARSATAWAEVDQEPQHIARSILHQREVGDDWQVTVSLNEETVSVTITGIATSAIPGCHWRVESHVTLPREIAPS